MIKKIRLMLEYNTYCIWLYDENDEIIDNDNPPEWDDDETLTQAFMAVSDLYDPKSRQKAGSPSFSRNSRSRTVISVVHRLERSFEETFTSSTASNHCSVR